jgi:hypothetical protein
MVLVLKNSQRPSSQNGKRSGDFMYSLIFENMLAHGGNH